MYGNKAIISVKEARKKLGVAYRSMTDAQVEALVDVLTRIAETTIKDHSSKINI